MGLMACNLCSHRDLLLEVLSLRQQLTVLKGRRCRSRLTIPNRVAVKNDDLEAVDPPCRDSKDNQFLALALVSEADILVSSDEDLLVLHPWRGLAIMRPVEFLSRSDALPETTTDE